MLYAVKLTKMTQEKANKIFDTDLGQQLLSIYCTSDDRVFIRYEEARIKIAREINPEIWTTSRGEGKKETICYWDKVLKDKWL